MMGLPLCQLKNMQISEITFEDIKRGKNWRIANPSEFNDLELEDLTIESCNNFSLNDYVVYSSIFVSDEGKVIPTVIIKEVGSPEHGGDMCEMIDGKWQRVGLNPNPTASVFGKEYVANPLLDDPSFDTRDEDDDERTYNKEEFRKWIIAHS